MIVPWYGGVTGDGTLDVELLVRIPEVFTNFGTYLLPGRELTGLGFCRGSAISFGTRPLRTSQASVSMKKFPE